MSIYITTRHLLRDAFSASSTSRDPVIQQCRAFNLMYAASTKRHLGNHKSLNYVRFKYSENRACELELWTQNPDAKIGRMTLDEALEEYIKPGVLLLRKNEPVEGETPQAPEQYVLVNMNTNTTPKDLATKLKGHSKGRGAKQLFLQTWADMSYCERKLSWAYHMLQSRLRVEIHVGERQKGDKDFRSGSRLFEDLVHLRPEVIQRAMPEGSGIIIDPQTNYQEYCWVVGPPRKKPPKESPEKSPEESPKKPPKQPENVTPFFYRNRKIQAKLKEKARRDTNRRVAIW